MSRDIRSFFTSTTGKKSSGNEKRLEGKKPKKSVICVISDDEEVIEATPPPKKACKHAEKLIPINVDAFFGGKTVKQSEVKFVEEKKNDLGKNKKIIDKKNRELEVHSADEDFQKTLLELDDDDLFVENIDILDKSVEEIKQMENTKGVKRIAKSINEGSSSKKAKLEQSDSGIDPDQERYEKKRYSAMLYQKYKNRSGPKHHGQKIIPEGKPNCLTNFTFLRTGVLDSLESDEFENLIKKYGGKVVHGVSRKVNYIVVGDDPGPSKLQKARDYNIKEINEDELLDMILIKSGLQAKFSKNQSEESGIGSECEKVHDAKMELDGDTETVKSQSGGVEKLLEQFDKLKDQHKIDEEQQKLSGKVKIQPEITEIPSEIGKKHRKMSDKHTMQTEDRKNQPVESKCHTDSLEFQSWSEKYRPRDVKGIIGQQDSASNLNKLKRWLLNWHRNQKPEIRKKISKPSPWAKNDDGAYFKAALLSGPPGIGKTTTATLVCKELGLDIVEFNASITRNKKSLHEQVAQLVSTTTLKGYVTGQTEKAGKNRVLLMDEVDGMAGNEDRGGINELINLIKTTNIPIICMCNDRNHQKMRTFVNYCFDLKFNKPKMEQIRGAMLSICFKENIEITPKALSDLIVGTNCDVRQILNHLSMLSVADKNISNTTIEKERNSTKKDTVLGPWEVVRSVFTENERKQMTLMEKSRLFFFDYSLGPLFIQENYTNVTPNCPRNEIMRRVAQTADCLSKGDVIESKIRSLNNWSLLEYQAFFSSVIPGHLMSGNVTGRINFPSWLGKNSSANKKKRMLNEVYMHTRTSTSCSKLGMNLDYLSPLRNAVLNPMIKDGLHGVRSAFDVMKCYNLLREDLDSLVELCQWRNSKNLFNQIDPKVKSAFTRLYNKESVLLPFAPISGVSKKKHVSNDGFSNDEESDDEDNDNIDLDAMIKVKSKTAANKSNQKATKSNAASKKVTKRK